MAKHGQVLITEWGVKFLLERKAELAADEQEG